MSRVFAAESQALSYIAKTTVTLFDDPLPFVGVISLDEVGRGSLAGAVVTGASLWLARDSSEQIAKQKWIRKVDDSKALSPEQRDECYTHIVREFSHLTEYNVTDCENSAVQYNHLYSPCEKPHAFRYERKKNPNEKVFSCLGIELGSASVEEIDEHNIWGAVQLGFGRALTKLRSILQKHELAPEQFVIVVDGKLAIKVPKEFAQCRQVTSIGGDALFVSIGCSSVVAKVVRDRYMCALANNHLNYGFDGHKGYATPAHRDAIKQFGASPLHRSSFLSNLL